MSDLVRVEVAGTGLWTPGYGDTNAWQNRTPDPELTAPKAPILNRQCIRRASRLARSMANAVGQALTQSNFDPPSINAVFGSAIGESSTMLKLLEQIWQGGEDDVSPMMFATSVHNAASGLVSISTKNRKITTSIAADYDTPAMALMEAVGIVTTTNTPTVVVCGDEAAPDGLVDKNETFDTLAIALVLAPAAPSSDRAQLSGLAKTPATIAGADAPGILTRNPQMGLLDLVDVVLRQDTGRVALDRGGGDGWTVEVTQTP